MDRTFAVLGRVQRRVLAHHAVALAAGLGREAFVEQNHAAFAGQVVAHFRDGCGWDAAHSTAISAPVS